MIARLNLFAATMAALLPAAALAVTFHVPGDYPTIGDVALGGNVSKQMPATASASGARRPLRRSPT